MAFEKLKVFVKNVIAITGCGRSHTRLDKSFTITRRLGLQFEIKACPGPPGVWTQEVRVSNHLLKKLLYRKKKKLPMKKFYNLLFTIYKLKNEKKMQVKGALKKASLKVAMGLPSTARYSAYIALLLSKVGSKGFA